MKKRTVFIGAILSLIPLVHPLLIKTGVVFSSSAVMLFLPEKVNAENSEFYFNRAFEKGKNGDHYGAISDFTKAIEITPSEGAYYNRGWNKSKLKDYYGAISDYTKAIEIDPNNENIYVNRGRSYYSLNDKGMACEDFKKAVFLGSTSTKEWLNSEGGSWCRNM